MTLDQYVKKSENKDWGMYYNMGPDESQEDEDYDPLEDYDYFKETTENMAPEFG